MNKQFNIKNKQVLSLLEEIQQLELTFLNSKVKKAEIIQRALINYLSTLIKRLIEEKKIKKGEIEKIIKNNELLVIV